MGLLADSRFNPAPGVLDFWTEFKKPNPWRWPILAVSMLPFGLIFVWLSSETVYTAPERPQITYVTTYEPGRTDEEIIASNIANQEVKELREAQQEALEQRKRDLYKALGAATGMDVEEADRRGEEARAAAAAQEQQRLDELMGRTGETDNAESQDEPASEGQTP
ncbi:MAG: hypothetical protein AAF697_13360 [Pseudomonadota bacterium]